MPDSHDHPCPQGTEAVFRSSRRPASNSRPQNSPADPQLNGDSAPGFDRLLEMIKGLIGLELAAAGAAGEQMSLRERTVRLRLEVVKYVLAALLVLAIIGLQIAVFVISPLLFSFNLLLAALGTWRQFGRKEKSTADDKREGDP